MVYKSMALMTQQYASNIDVVGNYIGTTGSTAESNAIGVYINNSSDVTVGGSTAADTGQALRTIPYQATTSVLIELASSL